MTFPVVAPLPPAQKQTSAPVRRSLGTQVAASKTAAAATTPRVATAVQAGTAKTLETVLAVAETAPATKIVSKLPALASAREAYRAGPSSSMGFEGSSPRLGRRRTFQLKEQKVFLNWTLSAREKTPNSQYNPLESGQPSGGSPAPDTGTCGWLYTLRTALDASHARMPLHKEDEGLTPAEACTTKAQWRARVMALAMSSADPDSRCSCLDGHWLSEDDNQYLGCALKGYFHWKDGSQMRLSVHGDRSDMVRIRIGGVYHYGMISEDGRRLRWSDGDTWLRLCPQSSTDEAARLAADWSFDVEESLRWQNWSAQTRVIQSSHTAKSLAAAEHVSRSMMSRETLADNLAEYFAAS